MIYATHRDVARFTRSDAMCFAPRAEGVHHVPRKRNTSFPKEKELDEKPDFLYNFLFIICFYKFFSLSCFLNLANHKKQSFFFSWISNNIAR